MLKHLFKGVLSAVMVRVLDNYRHLSIELLKIESTRSYVHGVQRVRTAAIGLVRMALVIALVCLGVVLVHAGLFILLPWSVKAKAVFGLSLGVIYAAAGGWALRSALAERTWMEKSGAADMLNDAIGEPRKG